MYSKPYLTTFVLETGNNSPLYSRCCAGCYFSYTFTAIYYGRQNDNKANTRLYKSTAGNIQIKCFDTKVHSNEISISGTLFI